jgi:hypothetical protein
MANIVFRDSLERFSILGFFVKRCPWVP